MPCWDGFGNLADGRPFFTGYFDLSAGRNLLFFSPSDGNWWRATFNGNAFEWYLVGNTLGLGSLPFWRRIWVGNFSGQRRSELLYYYPDDFSNPGERTFRLGQFQSDINLTWMDVGTTPGFGPRMSLSRSWIGNFSGDGPDELLVYLPGKRDWWLGHLSGTSLRWFPVGNTAWFGEVEDGRPFWTGGFRTPGQTEIMFYFPGDQNWWLGQIQPDLSLTWKLVGNTAGFGQIWDGRPFWTGYFGGTVRSEILFFTPADHNWWRGGFVGERLEWTFAGNTRGFGLLSDGRPIWTGPFTKLSQHSVLFYSNGDHTWWLGEFLGQEITWKLVGNTQGFGDLTGGGRKIYVGDFNADGVWEILFYYPTDGNWWMGRTTNGSLNWNLVSNTGRSYSQRLPIHIKILSPPMVPIETSINNLRDLLKAADIRLDVLSTETFNLMDRPDLLDLQDLDVGVCWGLLIPEHDRLFQNRNNVQGEELVIYFVRSVLGSTGTLNGCAAHPPFRPGAVCSRGSSQWTLAHEVGHVLGLPHVDEGQCNLPGFTTSWLMTGCSTNRIIGQARLSSLEQNIIRDSGLTHVC